MRIIANSVNSIRKCFVAFSSVFQSSLYRSGDCNFTDLLLHLFEHNSFVIYDIPHIDIINLSIKIFKIK